MHYQSSVRSLVVALVLFAACKTAPTNNEPCDFLNAGYCDDTGQLLKVCAPPPLDPISADIRWQDAPPSRWAKTSCGCIDDPQQGAPSVACLTTYTDEGKLCPTPTADRFAGGTILAEQPLHLHVYAPQCASACSHDLVVSCAIKREGNTLRVTSSFVASEPLAGICNLACREQVADCTSEPLPAGQYTLVQGSQTTQLTIPSTVAEAYCKFW